MKDLRYLLKEEILKLRLDLARRFWLREKVVGIWNDEGIRGIYKLVRGLMGKYENAELAARYKTLEQYPARSLGRCYWEYCRNNGFALPGEKGGAPEQILFHDCAHILSGYGTAPEEEVQVACFSAGFQRRDPFTFILFVLLQFHVGIRMTPITEARTGFFDPEKAMIAVRRGAAMNVDLNNGWEYWPVMGEQVEDLRRRYNILPWKHSDRQPGKKLGGSHDTRTLFQDREISVAVKPRDEWREANRWSAEERINGYDALGYTTTID